MTDIEPDYTGRPFGGISCIFKKNPNFNVKEIEILSDRLIALGLYDMSDSLVQVICCVYMPFFDRGNKNQLSLYVETLDMLQSLFDTYAHLAPIKLLGDFNTQLPTNIKLEKKMVQEKRF